MRTALQHYYSRRRRRAKEMGVTPMPDKTGYQMDAFALALSRLHQNAALSAGECTYLAPELAREIERAIREYMTAGDERIDAQRAAEREGPGF